jgi:FkbM family methyltransferase
MTHLDKLRDELKLSHPDKKLVFFDIGANIGWFTFTAASKGIKVKAFEPFTMNTFALKFAICLNKPEISDNI